MLFAISPTPSNSNDLVPTKQYIIYLNQLKNIDKKFIIEDLDSTHLLVKKKARDEISRKVEAWMDEVSIRSVQMERRKVGSLCACLVNLLPQNFFSAVERVGEDLDMS